MAPQKDAVARFRAAGEKIVALHPEFSILWYKVRDVTVDASIPTCVVNAQWQVKVNADFVLRLPEKDLLFICAHEVFHPVLQHFARAKALNVQSPEDLKLWNVAADMAINHAITEGLGMPAPHYALLPPHGYTGAIDTESLYKYLKKEEDEQPQPGNTPMPGQGCGMETEDGQGNGDEGDEANAQVAETMAGVLRGMGNHKLANALSPRRTGEKNWEKLLRAAFSGGNFQRGYAHSSYARPRRQGGLLLPRYRTPLPTLAVVIDTSYSIERAQINAIIGETVKLARTYSDVKTLLATHTDVVNFCEYVTNTTSVDSIAGACAYGGGTRATPAYEAVRDIAGKVDWLVHFTDCELEARDWPKVPARRLFVGSFASSVPYTTPPHNAKVLSCRD